MNDGEIITSECGEESKEKTDYELIKSLQHMFDMETMKDKPGNILPSDILELYDDKESRFYLCDIISFKPILFDKTWIKGKMYTLETLLCET